MPSRCTVKDPTSTPPQIQLCALMRGDCVTDCGILASAPHDGVLISVPKGSYTSVFEVNPLTFAPPCSVTSPDIHAVARLAVLPFVNLTDDPNRDYLADGLADETIATLGQIDPLGLVVIGRTSMMRYKATTKSLADIGRELDADYLLESSVRTEHDRLRVITGLVRARDQVRSGHMRSIAN